jgi:hypothetical protein
MPAVRLVSVRAIIRTTQSQPMATMYMHLFYLPEPR